MRYECKVCGRVYNHDGCVEVEKLWCSGMRVKHTRTEMTERDPYQAKLDDLGIPLNDPLRFAE